MQDITNPNTLRAKTQLLADILLEEPLSGIASYIITLENQVEELNHKLLALQEPT